MRYLLRPVNIGRPNNAPQAYQHDQQVYSSHAEQPSLALLVEGTLVAMAHSSMQILKGGHSWQMLKE